MTTPNVEGQPGAEPDRVERIRRRLIWALLLPFCILMSVAALEGFSSEDASHPGAAIAITVLCTNFVGDALRDAFDPRMGTR